MFGWEWDSWERCGEVVVVVIGLVGTTTLGGCGVLRVALGGHGEVDGAVMIPTEISVKAGRK